MNTKLKNVQTKLKVKGKLLQHTNRRIKCCLNLHTTSIILLLHLSTSSFELCFGSTSLRTFCLTHSYRVVFTNSVEQGELSVVSEVLLLELFLHHLLVKPLLNQVQPLEECLLGLGQPIIVPSHHTPLTLFLSSPVTTHVHFTQLSYFTVK